MRSTSASRLGLLIVGVLLLQTAWLVTVPPFRGSDEVDHVFRASAVAHGEWVAGGPATDGRGWLVTVPGSLVLAARDQCKALAYNGADNCAPVSSRGSEMVVIASSAANYNPLFYYVVGFVSLPFDGVAALYAMRIASAGLCLMFLAMALWAATRVASRWLAASSVLAMSPVFIYSTTVVAPNGLEMSAALALWASLLALVGSQQDIVTERWLVVVALGSCAVLTTLRLLGPMFIVLVFLFVIAFRSRNMMSVLARHRGMFATGAAFIAVALGASVLWTVGPWQLASQGHKKDGAETLELDNLLLWPLQSIAAFPYRNQMGPLLVYAIVGSLAITLVSVALRVSNLRDRCLLLSSVLVALALPVALTLATLDSRGVIWQGRYGLPFSVGFILIAGLLVGSKVKQREVPWIVTIPSLVAYGGALVACLVKVRDAELAENLASRADGNWQVPASGVIVLLIVLSMASLAIATSARSREQQ